MTIDVLPVIALVLSVGSFGYQVLKDRRLDAKQLLDKLTKQEADIVELKAKTSLFWSIMEKHAASILHHPTQHERDRLIDGYLEGALTPDELQAFVHDLDGLVNDDSKPPGERLAASMMLLSINYKHGVTVG